MAPTSVSLPSSSVSAASAQITYTAKVFMAGMKITVPSDSWSIHEDHPGEFNLAAPAPTMANIHFWLDPYPSLRNDKPVHGVGRTPTALIAWLRSDPSFIVSAPKTTSIASGTPATTFILNLSKDCIDFFVFRGPAYDFPYGTCPGRPRVSSSRRLAPGRGRMRS